MGRYNIEYALKLFGFYKHSQTESEITSTDIEYIGSDKSMLEDITKISSNKISKVPQEQI